MELTQDSSTSPNAIQSFDGKVVKINGKEYRNSLIVTPEKIIEDWPAKTFDNINTGSLQTIIDLKPQILILGTGQTQQFLNPELTHQLYRHHIGIEAMTNDAACRTFNVLLSEYRDVVLVLML